MVGCVSLRRITASGLRKINVPLDVAIWAANNVTPQSHLLAEQSIIDCPVSGGSWKILKSYFRGETYIGFARYEGKLRVG